MQDVGEVFIGIVFLKKKENRSYFEKFYGSKIFSSFQWMRTIVGKLIEIEKGREVYWLFKTRDLAANSKLKWSLYEYLITALNFKFIRVSKSGATLLKHIKFHNYGHAPTA